MLGTAIFYAAFLSTILQINGLNANQLHQVLRLLETRDVDIKSSSSSESSSAGDDAHSFVDHNLKTEDVIRLIQQANKNKKAAQMYNNEHNFIAKSNALNQLYENSQYEVSKDDKDNYGIKNRLFKQFIQKEKKPLKNSNHHQLTPNRLLSLINHKLDEGSETKNSLNKYSKIFVILDPMALQKSRNTENLPKLLSRILAETSATVDKSRQDKNKIVGSYYKGFPVKDSSKRRRFRRESRETVGSPLLDIGLPFRSPIRPVGSGLHSARSCVYGGGRDGDVDADYKPKRSRSEHSAGGGGRTAIPYIRQRGDIYERDH